MTFLSVATDHEIFDWFYVRTVIHCLLNLPEKSETFNSQKFEHVEIWIRLEGNGCVEWKLDTWVLREPKSIF